MKITSPIRYLIISFVFIVFNMAGVLPLFAQGGHGPAFGLATPTGGKGGLSYNATFMSIAQDNPTAMMRHTWNYSPTQRLQLNFSAPTPIQGAANRPRTRGGSLMPGFGDIELSAFYRFHQNNLGVGKRFESTVITGLSYPIDEKRGGINPGNAFHIAAVTGYASRSWYFWGGAGWQYYLEKSNEQLGDIIYTTGVIGYRPTYFRENRPNHDWRIFVEGASEWTGSDHVNETSVADTDNHKILIGPSLLGLYGAWGVSIGALFPVYEARALNPETMISGESPRIMVNLSYWFF
ncbi:MAG: hypothetical protein WD035_04195 [Balneolaceae bacterium]